VEEKQDPVKTIAALQWHVEGLVNETVERRKEHDMMVVRRGVQLLQQQ